MGRWDEPIIWGTVIKNGPYKGLIKREEDFVVVAASYEGEVEQIFHDICSTKASLLYVQGNLRVLYVWANTEIF